MRPLTQILTLMLTALALAAAVAYAREAPPVASVAKPAPFELIDARQPPTYRLQQQAFSFMPVSRISAKVAAGSSASAQSDGERRAGAAASVTVTAVVLPSVVIQLAEDATVREISTNTHDRALAQTMIVILDPSGESRSHISAAEWRTIATALGQAHAGTGKVWSS